MELFQPFRGSKVSDPFLLTKDDKWLSGIKKNASHQPLWADKKSRKVEKFTATTLLSKNKFMNNIETINVYTATGAITTDGTPAQLTGVWTDLLGVSVGNLIYQNDNHYMYSNNYTSVASDTVYGFKFPLRGFAFIEIVGKDLAGKQKTKCYIGWAKGTMELKKDTAAYNRAENRIPFVKALNSNGLVYGGEDGKDQRVKLWKDWFGIDAEFGAKLGADTGSLVPDTLSRWSGAQNIFQVKDQAKFLENWKTLKDEYIKVADNNTDYEGPEAGARLGLGEGNQTSVTKLTKITKIYVFTYSLDVSNVTIVVRNIGVNDNLLDTSLITRTTVDGNDTWNSTYTNKDFNNVEGLEIKLGNLPKNEYFWVHVGGQLTPGGTRQMLFTGYTQDGNATINGLEDEKTIDAAQTLLTNLGLTDIYKVTGTVIKRNVAEQSDVSEKWKKLRNFYWQSKVQTTSDNTSDNTSDISGGAVFPLLTDKYFLYARSSKRVYHANINPGYIDKTSDTSEYSQGSTENARGLWKVNLVSGTPPTTTTTEGYFFLKVTGKFKSNGNLQSRYYIGWVGGNDDGVIIQQNNIGKVSLLEGELDKTVWGSDTPYTKNIIYQMEHNDLENKWKTMKNAYLNESTWDTTRSKESVNDTTEWIVVPSNKAKVIGDWGGPGEVEYRTVSNVFEETGHSEITIGDHNCNPTDSHEGENGFWIGQFWSLVYRAKIDGTCLHTTFDDNNKGFDASGTVIKGKVNLRQSGKDLQVMRLNEYGISSEFDFNMYIKIRTGTEGGGGGGGFVTSEKILNKITNITIYNIGTPTLQSDTGLELPMTRLGDTNEWIVDSSNKSPYFDNNGTFKLSVNKESSLFLKIEGNGDNGNPAIRYYIGRFEADDVNTVYTIDGNIAATQIKVDSIVASLGYQAGVMSEVIDDEGNIDTEFTSLKDYHISEQWDKDAVTQPPWEPTWINTADKYDLNSSSFIINRIDKIHIYSKIRPQLFSQKSFTSAVDGFHRLEVEMDLDRPNHWVYRDINDYRVKFGFHVRGAGKIALMIDGQTSTKKPKQLLYTGSLDVSAFVYPEMMEVKMAWAPMNGQIQHEFTIDSEDDSTTSFKTLFKGTGMFSAKNTEAKELWKGFLQPNGLASLGSNLDKVEDVVIIPKLYPLQTGNTDVSISKSVDNNIKLIEKVDWGIWKIFTKNKKIWRYGFVLETVGFLTNTTCLVRVNGLNDNGANTSRLYKDVKVINGKIIIDSSLTSIDEEWNPDDRKKHPALWIGKEIINKISDVTMITTSNRVYSLETDFSNSSNSNLLSKMGVPIGKFFVKTMSDKTGWVRRHMTLKVDGSNRNPSSTPPSPTPEISSETPEIPSEVELTEDGTNMIYMIIDGKMDNGKNKKLYYILTLPNYDTDTSGDGIYYVTLKSQEELGSEAMETTYGTNGNTTAKFERVSDNGSLWTSTIKSLFIDNYSYKCSMFPNLCKQYTLPKEPEFFYQYLWRQLESPYKTPEGKGYVFLFFFIPMIIANIWTKKFGCMSMSAFYSFIQIYIGSVSALLYVYYTLQENEKVVAEQQAAAEQQAVATQQVVTSGTSWERFQHNFWLTIDKRKWNSVEGVFNTCVYVIEALLLISFLATIIYSFIDRAAITVPNFGVSNLGSSITQRARSSANTALQAAINGNQMPTDMAGMKKMAGEMKMPTDMAGMKKMAGGMKMPSMSGMKMPSMTGMKMPSMTGMKMPSMSGMKMPSKK